MLGTHRYFQIVSDDESKLDGIRVSRRIHRCFHSISRSREKKFHLSAGLASSEFFTFEILADKDWRGTARLLSLNICEAEK